MLFFWEVGRDITKVWFGISVNFLRSIPTNVASNTPPSQVWRIGAERTQADKNAERRRTRRRDWVSLSRSSRSILEQAQ